MERIEGKQSACENGGTPPISALTYAFSIGLNRGRKTDDFGRRVIVLKPRSLPARARKAPQSRRKAGASVWQAIARRRSAVAKSAASRRRADDLKAKVIAN
jgi:hypothetical protein